MRQIAFDESGNSGQNLLDGSQPVYVLASVAREEKDIASSVAELVQQSQFEELKFSDMRYSGELGVLDAVFASGLVEPISARAVPVDKVWMVAGKIVDLLLEPGVSDTHGFYASGAHRKIASILYHQGPKEVGPEVWSSLRPHLSLQRGHRGMRTIFRHYRAHWTRRSCVEPTRPLECFSTRCQATQLRSLS